MIFVDGNKKIPLYEQIYNGLKKAIINEELPRGSRLKPIRSLANELNVSNNTISKAYQQLLAEGYIKSIQGSGYYVRKIIINSKKRKIADDHTINQKKAEIIYDFDYEPIDSRIFPWSKWRHYLMKAISDEEINKIIGYEDKRGSIELRRELCKYVYQSRGIKCDPEQLIICAGKQYALDIILDILPEEYNKAGIEDPCLQRVRKSFCDKKKIIQSIPVTDTGIDIGYLERSGCNLLYTTPSHNFPLGHITTLTKRVQIAEWAKRNNNYVIEDDFENEFFDGRQNIPAITSLDKSEQVIYMHTLSRILSPSIRCTYIILPKKLMPLYEERYKYYYTAIPIHNQNALAAFIRDGHLERQSRKTQKYNQKKYMKMKFMFEHLLSDEVIFREVSSYSHVLLEIPACTDGEELRKYMVKSGIKCFNADSFWLEKSDHGGVILVLGFHGIEEEDLDEACEEFANVLKEYLTMQHI